MIKYLTILVLFMVLKLELINGTTFQGGTMNYRILKSSAETVTIRYFQKFLQVHPNNKDEEACSGNCLSNPIPGDSVDYKRQGGTINDTKTFDGSVYCDSIHTTEDFFIASRETDVVLNRTFTNYEFRYVSCCAPDATLGITQTFRFDRFLINANLKERSDTKKINSIPDTTKEKIYIEMRRTKDKEYKFVFPDADGDIVRCEFSTKLCDKGTCNDFSLEPSNCTLKLVTVPSAQKFAIGIVVKDYEKTTTNFSATPLSTVPFYFIVNVLNDLDNRTRSVYECPANRKKPIQFDTSAANFMNLTFSTSIFSTIIFLVSSNLMRMF